MTRSPDAFVPTPETWHPSLSEGIAMQVMERCLWPPSQNGEPKSVPPAVEILESRALANWLDKDSDPEDTLPIRKTLFTIQRYMGLAPFIGDPRSIDIRYVWLVANDAHGRWIAGPTNLVWRDIVAGAPSP